MVMRNEFSVPLAGNRTVKLRYGAEEASPDTYYDHMHEHNILEICIVLSGKMLHFARGKTYRLSFGDVFFCRPHEPHYALAAEPSVYERYAIWIPTDAFSFIGEGNDSALGIFSDKRYSETNVLRISPENLEDFGHYLDAFGHCLDPKSGQNPLLSFSKMTELLCFINNDVRNHDPDSEMTSAPDIIYKVIRYVRKNYASITGVDEVAAHFFINKDYLTRVFRRFAGFTVHDYIRNVRISNSKIMLKSGMSVTEAGYACGFNSTSYFIRVFSQATGITPAVYRADGTEVTENRE